MASSELGKLLLSRAGVSFRVQASPPKSLDIGPYIDEAILLARRTDLAVFLALPRMTLMTVDSSSDRSRLVDGWQARLRDERNPYLGRNSNAAKRDNKRERARHLGRTARSMSTPYPKVWALLKKGTRNRYARSQIELAERWARLMEEAQKRRMNPRDIVYTSLYIADADGEFGMNTREYVLDLLVNFWPYYRELIQTHLDDF